MTIAGARFKGKAWEISLSADLVGYAAVGRWDGTAWTLTPIPDARGLQKLWGTTGDDVWAIGGAWAADSGVVMRWNGSAWSALGGSWPEYMSAIWGSSSTDVWTTGADEWGWAFLAHWDGTSWSTPPLWATGRAMWGSGPDDVWLAGEVGAWHRDAAGWSETACFPYVDPQAMWGAVTGDLWVVGRQGSILRRRP